MGVARPAGPTLAPVGEPTLPADLTRAVTALANAHGAIDDPPAPTLLCHEARGQVSGLRHFHGYREDSPAGSSDGFFGGSTFAPGGNTNFGAWIAGGLDGRSPALMEAKRL